MTLSALLAVFSFTITSIGAGQDSLDILFSSLDIRELEACLVRHNAVMLLKMHYYHQESNPFADMVHHQSRIHWLSAEESPELNPLLPFVDVLITDYSSAYIDYLLLDRPVVFAPFDLEQYLANDRELYEDYDSSTPGPKCISWEEVINALDDVFSGTDQYKDARKQAISKYHSYVDANSCQRVYEVALELVNG